MLRAFTVLGGLLAIGAAVAAPPPPSPAPPPAVEATAPWTAMALPLEGGTVTFSEDHAIVVSYREQRAFTLLDRYDDALQLAGWRAGEVDFDDDALQVRYRGPAGQAMWLTARQPHTTAEVEVALTLGP